MGTIDELADARKFLGITSSTSLEEARKRRNILAIKYSPDSNPITGNENMLVKLNKYWEILMDYYHSKETKFEMSKESTNKPTFDKEKQQIRIRIINEIMDLRNELNRVAFRYSNALIDETYKFIDSKERELLNMLQTCESMNQINNILKQFQMFLIKTLIRYNIVIDSQKIKLDFINYLYENHINLSQDELVIMYAMDQDSKEFKSFVSSVAPFFNESGNSIETVKQKLIKNLYTNQSVYLNHIREIITSIMEDLAIELVINDELIHNVVTLIRDKVISQVNYINESKNLNLLIHLSADQIFNTIEEDLKVYLLDIYVKGSSKYA